jgi:hypothetical protein
MRAVIVCESMFGSTKKVAEAIAEGLADCAEVSVVPAFTGRASKSIRRLLAHHGARIAASPESFLVEGLTGALAEGELERARAWGERLSGVTASEASPGRRQAS